MNRFTVFLEPGLGMQPRVLKLLAKNYRSGVLGGPISADIDVVGPAVAQGALQNWLGQGVEIRNEYGSVVWWGMVIDVRFAHEGDGLGISLDEMTNRINVIYAVTDVSGAELGQETGWAADANSVSKYGIKELLESGGRMASAAAATARLTTLLRNHSLPGRTLSFDGQYKAASIGCVGWWETLAWRIAQRREGRIEWEGEGDAYRQAVGWGIVASNRIGFHLSALHDLNARLGVLQEGDKVVVSGAGVAGNNKTLTIEQSSDVAQVVYQSSSIWFDPGDDIHDNGGGLGFVRADEFLQVQGSASNSRYHLIDSTGEDHITVKYTITGNIATEAPGPLITLTQGHRATTLETVSNEVPGASVTLNLYGQALYQTFTPDHVMNGAQIAVKVGKVGSPIELFEVGIWSDSGGLPVARLGTAYLSAAGMAENPEWRWLAVDTPPTFTAGVTYGLRVVCLGAPNALDYYQVELVRDTSYSGVCKAWSGTAWVGHTQLVTMPFKVWGEEDTITQIARLLTDYGQFFIGYDLVVAASGVRTNQFIDNDQTAREEIEKLLGMGTSSGQRLLAQVTKERVVRIFMEPGAVEPMARLLPDRRIGHSGGGVRPAGQLPDGEWLSTRTRAGVASATGGAVFVDEAEYNVESGELALDFKKVT